MQPLHPRSRHADTFGVESPGACLPTAGPRANERRVAGDEVLQRFEGVVLAITERDVVVRLHDRSDPTRPDEEATFDLDRFSPDDRPLLEPGAVFDWTLTRSPSAREPLSCLQLRRPRWSRHDLERIEARAEELLSLFAPAPRHD